MTLSELETMEIPKIYDLRDAKIRLIEEKQKMQKKLEEQAKAIASQKKRSPKR